MTPVRPPSSARRPRIRTRSTVPGPVGAATSRRGMTSRPAGTGRTRTTDTAARTPLAAVVNRPAATVRIGAPVPAVRDRGVRRPAASTAATGMVRRRVAVVNTVTPAGTGGVVATAARLTVRRTAATTTLVTTSSGRRTVARIAVVVTGTSLITATKAATTATSRADATAVDSRVSSRRALASDARWTGWTTDTARPPLPRRSWSCGCLFAAL